MGLAKPAGNNDALSEGLKHKIDKLRVKHSLWKLYSPEWDMYLAAYEGGPDFANKHYLAKHVRENSEDWQERVQRLHYVNYCEPIVDFFTNFIFAESIDRNGGSNSDFYEMFINNVDKRGSSIEEFMRCMSDDVQIFGISYTLVDTPVTTSTQPFSKQDEIDKGIRPYWITLRPDEIVDWVVDDFDNYQYMKRFQLVNEINVAGEIVNIEKYTEWFPDRIVVNRIDITDPAKPALMPEEIVENGHGFIPILVVRYKRSKRYPQMGNSFLRDFAYNNKEIMNLTSLLQEFLYRQAFNILAVEADGSVPMRDAEDGVIGTANKWEYPKGANPPSYISPPSDPADKISEQINWIKREMFTRAAQDSLNEMFNGEGASGFSQAQSFSKTVPFIARRADTLERAENHLMELTMYMASKEWDGKIKYKDRYELTNLTDAITQLQMLAKDLQLPSKTFVVEEMKRLVHEYDGKLPDDIKSKIDNEIEGLDWSAWSETQKEALVGVPPQQGTSVTAQQKPKSTGTMKEASAEAKTSKTATKKKKGS